MTLVALWCASHGYTVLSNYHIKHQNVQVIDFYDFVNLLAQGRHPGRSLIAIDELQGWIDSRVSSSKSNRYATYVLFQSAKLGYDIVYTTQVNMRADIDYRTLADIRLKAEKDTANRQFVYTVMDPDVQDKEVPTGQELVIPYSVASVWWDRYDTYEAVRPVGLAEILQELKRSRDLADRVLS